MLNVQMLAGFSSRFFNEDAIRAMLDTKRLKMVHKLMKDFSLVILIGALSRWIAPVVCDASAKRLEKPV